MLPSKCYQKTERFLFLDKNPPEITEEILSKIDTDKANMQGNFCRGCGYCMPCPVGIEINTVARMSFLLRRAVWQNFVTPEGQDMMRKVHDCIDCGACKSRCPYDIDCPELMRHMLMDYEEFINEKGL